MRYFWIFICVGMSLCCTAQKAYKYEKESRIKKEAFPQNALEFLQQHLPEKVKKVKYYKEQDSLKESYETKLKFKKQKYSIEFDKDGTLEDVEITIKPKEIPSETFEKIKNHFQNTYDAFRIKKIQRQYKNTPTIEAKKVLKNAFSKDVNSAFFYEIIAEVKTKKKRFFIEITFTKDGDFQLVRTIIQSSYDHILY